MNFLHYLFFAHTHKYKSKYPVMVVVGGGDDCNKMFSLFKTRERANEILNWKENVKNNTATLSSEKFELMAW